MVRNPCLRPASLSDVEKLLWYYNHAGMADRSKTSARYALTKLYTAEWRLRGFERSP